MDRVLTGYSRRLMTQDAPSKCRFGVYSPMGPKVLLCAMAMLLGASVGQGEPVPDTILLPDSLGPLRPGYHLAFGSSTDNIYVASESSDIIVVDGNSFQRIKRINTGTPVGGALLVSQHNRLYCSYPQQGSIGVIDCATNDVIGSIDVGGHPKLLCYGSGNDKLYCGDSIGHTVSVIDCAADTIRKVISTGYTPTAMAYDPTTNKVYVATQYSVLAISCITDSIISNLGGEYGSGLCLNKRRQKLYVPGRVVPETIYVLSTQSDSVTAKIPTGLGVQLLLACNEATDRIYCGGFGSEDVDEYDCLGDTCTSHGYFLGYEGHAIACDTVRNRLFFRSACDLLVLDCATFDVVADIPLPGYDTHSDLLAIDPARYRAMCTGSMVSDWEALFVCDYKGDTPYVRGTAPLCGWTHTMCHNSATRRLYCSLGGVVSAVVDEQTNRVVKWASGVCGNMVHSRTSNKFYFSVTYGPSYEQQGLGVMDGSTDSLIKVVGLGDFRWDPFPCWCPVGNKVYCFASLGPRLYIAVVDCSTDSVVRTMDVYDLGRWFEYLDNGLILCNHSDSLALIDPRTDSVLVDSSLEAGGIYAVTHTGDGEKFYTARRYPGRLEVRSSSSLSLLATIDWPYFDWSGTLLTYSDTTRKLYWFVDDSVLAIDATSDTVTARMTTSVLYGGACLDHTGKYLFCASYNTLRVYDTRSDSLLAVYPQLPFPPLRVMSNPDLGYIYVACQDVILVYPDTPPGVEEAMSDERGILSTGASIVRGVLFLPGDRGPGTEDRPALMDVSGRQVMDPRYGANDVSRLSPGVYFLRGPKTRDGRPAAVRKIVLTR